MGAENSTVSVEEIEGIDKVWRFGTSKEISIEDIQWANDRIEVFRELCESQKFSTAVESYTTFNHIINLRMATALIWAGIESLFEVSQEITFRLSTIVASYLFERGEERNEFYNKFKKMYGFRSRAVHGAEIKIEHVHQHLDDTKDVFRAILIRIIEEGKLISRQDFEKNVFV